MNWQHELKSERDFLQRQIEQSDHRLQRLDSALGACRDCLEQEGLERTRRAAQVERALLQELLDRLGRSDALPLEAVIMEQMKTYNGAAQRLAHRWHRGQPTPDGYWEAETRYMLAGRLLRLLHAWQAGQQKTEGASASPRPDSTHDDPEYTHPWYVAGSDPDGGPGQHSSASDTLARLEALREGVYRKLAEIGYPEHHLDVVAPAGGIVIVRGWAHTEDERERAIEAVLQVNYVWEELSDIKVVAEAQCPVCHPGQASPAPPPPAPLRRHTRPTP